MTGAPHGLPAPCVACTPCKAPASHAKHHAGPTDRDRRRATAREGWPVRSRSDGTTNGGERTSVPPTAVSDRQHCRLEPLEGVAGVDVAGGAAGREPLLALRRRPVGP